VDAVAVSGDAPPVTQGPDGATEPTWEWDPSLYAGSARFYAAGRVAYPQQLAALLVEALRLDGSGTLLDVGCGPGSLTLLLAPHVAEAIGVDADADMLAEAARLADQQQLPNVTWRHLRGEDLPADLPHPRLVTFAQSFHWMDRPRVAAAVRRMLVADGALVHVGATTHRGLDGDTPLPHPRPPHRAIEQLVQRYLGQHRRAGKGVLAAGTPGDEDDVYRAAGFQGPQRQQVPGRVVERTAEQVLASVYSLSSSAPHLFGDRLPDFDEQLRRLLAGASHEGWFAEQLRPITVSIWR
jgi:SAM-dependent methyltransferase